jgi:nucleotide-binding universal stress UspA family protein
MPVNGNLRTGIPAAGVPARGDGPSLYRVLVPVGLPGGSDMALAVAAQLSAVTGGMLLLVHVRICDSPVPGCPGLFSPETAGDAALLDGALLAAWADGVVRAATAVVNAARADVARAIARHAAGWGADVIVMTREPRPAVSCLLLGSGVPDQVIREAHCPVVAVRPALRPAGAKAGHRIADRISHGRFSRHASR